MANLLISFLGTGNYVACCYDSEGTLERCTRPVRFVQESIIEKSCRGWGAEDRIRIFCTDSSIKKNWENDGHGEKKPGDPLVTQGLKARLDAMGLACSVEKILIPEGFSVEEMWEIFQKVYDEIREGDTLLLDITHSFRIFPLMASVFLQYAGVLKQARVAAIHYGAFEALGPAYLVENEMKMENRIAPLLDVYPLVQIGEWAMAVDRFLGAGDASSLKALTGRAMNPLCGKASPQKEAARSLNQVVGLIDAYARKVATCRGPELAPMVQSRKRAMADLPESLLLPQMEPLLKKVAARFADFEGDGVKDGIRVVRWCLEHGLVQQGFTILTETLLTWVVGRIWGAESEADRDLRYLASSAFQTFEKSLSGSGEACEPKNEQERKVWDLLKQYPGLASAFNKLRVPRNDINHGGYGRDEKLKDQVFASKLEEVLGVVEPMLLFENSGV